MDTIVKTAIPSKPIKTKGTLIRYIKKKKYLYLLLIPCVLYFFIFHYTPMYGVLIAFENFNFSKGIFSSPWVGFDNFKFMFQSKDFYRVFSNSISISIIRIFVVFPAPIVLALLINEIRSLSYKRFCQTIIYLPHFISWVVMGSILIEFLSPNWGVLNSIIKALGFEPIFFLAKTQYFKPIVIFSSIWKDTGWGTIIYLAALAGVNPEYYEAAIVDGANRWHKLIYITLPTIKSTIIIMLLLSIGRLMSNGFEQIFMLQNSMNLQVSEIFETYTYRIGLLSGRFSFSATVGLFTSLIGMILILISDRLAKWLGEEGVF